MLYQIKDWDKNFESAKSKTYRACSHVYVPNKQTGDGFTFILCQPDGPAIFGLWYLLVEACSLQTIPRQGYCTDTGRPDGVPWTAGLLARRWRTSEKLVQRMYDVTSSPPVSWISKDTTGIPQSPMVSNQSHPNPNPNPNPNPAATPLVPPRKVAAAPESALIVFPTAGNVTEWHLTQTLVDLYKTAYPAVDIIGECRKALVWVNCNNQKTSRGMKRFLNTWLSKAQNSYHGGGNGTNRGNTAQHGYHSGTHGAEVRAEMERQRAANAAVAQPAGDADSGGLEALAAESLEPPEIPY